MMVYPAYDLDRIHDRLSWRQVNSLLDTWKTYPPQAVGYLERKKEEESSDEDVMRAIMDMGIPIG